MNILVNYDVNGHAAPKIMNGFVKAFRQMGHQVTDHPAGDTLGNSYDMIFGYSGCSIIKVDDKGTLLSDLLNALVVQYWADDIADVGRLYRNGLILQSDLGCSENWTALGVKNIYMPLAADPELFFPTGDSKEYDIVMTGVPSAPRLEILRKLKILNIKIAVFGQWEQHWKLQTEFHDLYRGCAGTIQELNALYNRSKICIDISSPQNLNSANFTVFNAMASGTLLITNYKSALKGLFGNAKPPFYNGTDCLELVSKYLNDDSLRETEAAKQRDTIIAGHTFLHRAAELFKIIQ